MSTVTQHPQPLPSVTPELRELVLAMRSLILAGTSANERIAIHHAKQLLAKYENVR